MGRTFTCAMVFNDASPDWASWSDPWFTNPTYPDLSWTRWATARGRGRRLIITQNLFPASENGADWLALGASGAWEGHARALARRLVRVGLGDSVIRLAHEANGTWYPDSIPDTPAGDRLWVRFWQNTVSAMRSVPGAHFQFDWCVNAGTRDVRLASFYPGNRYVDIIGVDAYDSGVPAGPRRWSRIYHMGDGLAQVRAFALAHHRPFSIPEWGIGPQAEDQGGDDPGYVRGIAWVARQSDVAFQSYFDADGEMLQMQNSPNSLAEYARLFGSPGHVPTRARQARTVRTPVGGPQLRITGGPAYGARVQPGPVTFTFLPGRGGAPMCSLDGDTPARCSARGSDVLEGLAPGFHVWTVQQTDAADVLSSTGRVFVVR